VQRRGSRPPGFSIPQAGDEVNALSAAIAGKQSKYKKDTFAFLASSRAGNECAIRFPARCCVFRPKLITDSGANRSQIPVETDHRFRAKPISDSGGKLISFVAGTGIV
jgi:hypothetical protein